MDFTLSPQEEAFGMELRDWLGANLPPKWGTAGFQPFTDETERVAFLRDWQRKLYKGGWMGITWPKAYGGRGATLIEQAIFYEEMARAKAPELISAIGLDMAGPAIITHGTEEQKRRYLSKILSAEEIWCQGFSEPNAGSDLAALQTRAMEENDHFLVNGQKVWTSWAHMADWCLLLTRTDPSLPKHKGLTYLLVDVHSPGVTVRPLVQITGDAEFNEMFFDNVRAPKENVLGRVNGGWEVAITTLMYERGPRTMTRQLALRMALDSLVDMAKRSRRGNAPATEDRLMRQKLAQLWVDTEVLRYSNLRGLTRTLRGEPPGPEGSAHKLFWGETWQRLYEVALELEGMGGQVTAGAWAVDRGYWQYRFLRSRGDTIAAGTTEIQRNIIAERVLGLPKD